MSFNGLKQYCYQLGFDQTQISLPDPIGDALGAAPCTFVPEANKAYGQGVVDALVAQGLIKEEDAKDG